MKSPIDKVAAGDWALILRLIKIVQYSNIGDWSPYSILGLNVIYNENFELIKIGSFLKRNKKPIFIQDNMVYKRPTIRMYNNGIKIRDVEIGKNIGTKNQFTINKGQFLLSKIDARNGAFGVVPEDCDGGIITGNFWTFDVDYSKINPHFLNLLTSTSEFHSFCQSASVGTTNRNYLQEQKFLDTKIPLPPLEEQNRLVKRYNELVEVAEKQEEKAKRLEQEIEEYLLLELGIEIQKTEIKKGLQFVRFKDVTRWDYDYLLGSSNNIYHFLKNSHYEVKKLGDIYNFASKFWKKKDYKSSEFNYIEIGGIISGSDFIDYSTISLENAPSRATQIVNENDLIIGLTRPYLKKFVIINKEYDNFVCSSGFQVICPNINSNLNFLLEFLRTIAGVKQFENLMAGALYPAITSNDLKNVLIPLPPLSKQNEIVEKIEKMRAEIKELKIMAEENRKKAKADFEKEIFE